MGEDPVMIVYLLSMDGNALAKVLAERFGWMVVSPDDSVKSAADEGVNKTAWDLGSMLMDASLCDIVLLDEATFPEYLRDALLPALSECAGRTFLNFSGRSWFVLKKKYMRLNVDYVSAVIDAALHVKQRD